MTESQVLIGDARVNYSEQSEANATPPRDLDRNLDKELKTQDEGAKGCWERTRLFTGYAF